MAVTTAFTLNAAQQERLLACRAAWEEGEGEERLERLRQREEDAETLQAIARLLREADFAGGRDLTFGEMARLLALARALAPNPNLDARLLRRPGEPEELNRDLRDLLHGPASLPARLRGFLARRHAGGQTAMQLLCAAFPAEWPLVTQAALRALERTEEQKAAALREARERFGMPEGAEDGKEPGVPANDVVLRLLADVVALTEAKRMLQAADYVEAHRLLTRGLAGRGARRQAMAPLLYGQATASAPMPALARETPAAYGLEEEPETPADDGLEPEPPDIAGLSTAALLETLERAIAAQGFTYPPLTIRDYFISLQTKPFVLLSGLSGTGKTRLTALFAEALTGDAAAQYRLLPVRPDWADSAPLIGYVNLLAAGGEGRYVATPFLDFLRRASRPENAHRAFFLCLDEMNLARVEHYFAEILSAMETPTRELLLPDGRTLRLPANLFLTGTLNTDEATHSLSRKVLDRANTLVFQEVSLEEAACDAPPPASELSPAMRQAVFLRARVGSVAAARSRLRQLCGGADFAARIVDRLTEANRILEPHGLHFAYRVRDEILRYCANSFDRDGSGLLVPDAPEDSERNLRVALDLQIAQKVLPRLSGTQEQLETPLALLTQWAASQGFPATARRLSRLSAQLQRDGFVTWDAI